VLDERTIRIDIPESERAGKSAFVAAVLSAEVNVTQLDLPAQVIINPRTMVIIITGDVEISPGVVTHRDLIINTTIPAPSPTAAAPILQRQTFAEVRTRSKASDNARLADLMAALKQLDVNVTDQIDILKLLHKTGRLHAKLIID
jgi:flagellar P-ring protein precursor FlgI